MLGDNIDVGTLKYGLLCIFTTLTVVFVFLFKLITGSYLLGLLVFIALMWFLIFKIGTVIMYPGHSFFFYSNIIERLSTERIKDLNSLGLCLQAISQVIVTKQYHFRAGHHNLEGIVMGNIHLIIETFSMFENTLSEKKQKILEIMREMLSVIQSPHQQPSLSSNEQPWLRSLAQFLATPSKIRNVPPQQHEHLCNRIKAVLHLNSHLQEILLTYIPPPVEVSKVEHFKFQVFEEKFYEIRFGFQRWNAAFEYEVHLINNVGYTLESAIIKRRRNRASQQSPVQNRYVMFCNPNGVYIQFFGVQNTYVRQYLKQGYQVILWNYRGYGQSTGTPSITKSQTDAMKIYNYYTQKGLNIQIIHGYSIGGCAAIGLASKLEKQYLSEHRQGVHSSVDSLHSETRNNSVKLLIVDRSFSSIGNMAIEFGPFLYKLARIVFFLQNKNLSQIFSELKMEKLIIWDHKDEVIPDVASLKGGILSAIVPKKEKSTCHSCTNCYKEEEEARLNEQVSVLINEKEQLSPEQLNVAFLHKFASSLKNILKFVKSAEDEQQKGKRIDDEILNTESFIAGIFKEIYQIDGGGSMLPSPEREFKKLLEANPVGFDCRCESFLLGLVFYGNLYPVGVAFSKRSDIQAHTLKNLNERISSMESLIQKASATDHISKQAIDCAKDLVFIFVNAKNIIENTFNLEEQKKYGKLVAVHNGHNGSLTDHQLRHLTKYIKEICDQERSTASTVSHISEDRNSDMEVEVGSPSLKERSSEKQHLNAESEMVRMTKEEDLIGSQFKE